MGRATKTTRRASALSRGNKVGPVQPRSRSPSFSQALSEDENDNTPSSSASGEEKDLLTPLPNTLVQFLSKSPTSDNPPRKRQKTNAVGTRQPAGVNNDSTSKEGPLEHIVVKRTNWNIKLAGNNLSHLDEPLEKQDIQVHIIWLRTQPLSLDILDDSGNSVFQVSLPHERSDLQDVLLSLAVHKDSKRWAQEQGRLWTEFGANLSREQGIDTLQVTFTIKWNTTLTPYDIFPSARKTTSLCEVLSRYFPDSNVNAKEKWSPQDFYQNVHAPNKTDGASSLEVPGLETNLYPFQNRAVHWLLQREGVVWSANTGIRETKSRSGESDLPITFIQAEDADGKICFISHAHGLVTLDVHPFKEAERELRGGILAEEMGLGKTVEMISLISLHRRPKEALLSVFDPFTGTQVTPTSATLIISPPSILQQWISEINKHAPHLKVVHYEGISANRDDLDSVELLESLSNSDVVVSTYSVLAGELHFTHLNPEKSLRNEPKYPRPKSPLMQLQWYRVCIDEAQMIGVSNAATVARMIPRVNAWCVTGTPVHRDISDLLGLLVFLRCEPYASYKHVWASIISSHKHDFRRLFRSLALRHSKQSVRDELKLPAQRRYVITMPFTPVEEQHYQELFNQMCEDCGLDAQGAPLTDPWDPEIFSEKMRSWLVRLRQTALHPEVGGRNRRALGNKDGPLRTVDQVLDVMIEQTEVAIRTDQRNLLFAQLKRGQLFENSPRVKEAFEIWDKAAGEASEIVREARQQLEQEVEKSISEGRKVEESAAASTEIKDNSDEPEAEIDPASRLGIFRNRLRGALEVEHMAVFYRANAYFQIKSNEEMTKPDSLEFQDLEKREMEGYDKAKKLRREILQEIYKKADKLMIVLAEKSAAQTFTEIPEFPTKLPSGGIESRRIVEKLDILASALDDQAAYLDHWREQIIQFLMRPLVDEDDEVDPTGEEYEESTKLQDEIMAFVTALRAVIADRHDALTGQHNLLIEHDMDLALHYAEKKEGPSPSKSIELLTDRRNIKPPKEMGSVRGIVAELRALSNSLKLDAETGSSRAQQELLIVEKQLSFSQKHLGSQTKVTAALEKELNLFIDTMNTRLEYYRQLQQVSDMVGLYEGPINNEVITKMLKDEDALSSKIAKAKSKHRYLDHLKKEVSNPQEQRFCVICRESFEIGALTVCGHQYCKECIGMWWSAHHNCPVCKRKLSQSDMHQITYKPQELSIEAEEVTDAANTRTTFISSSNKSAIYTEISKTKLAEIKNVDLDGPSFTTKVDTLARHLIWLRESDPGAKSIIYSQFKDFLDVLAQAFARFRIGYSSIDKANGIESFKQDPSIECFLLHSRAHSSGLNLVNASHVFLCEPLLNTALELQAIARVDRIGQSQETNVWLYLVDGTVEESIHQLSVKRRLEHIGKTQSKAKGKSKELSPEDILDSKLEEANSLELQEASLGNLLAKDNGGEMVLQKDLWECLFGGAGRKIAQRTLDNSDIRFDVEVSRHLRAEAAEERQG